MADVVIAPTGGASASHPGYGTRSYRAYVLGVLFVIYAINLLDRGLIGLLQEPIKKEFGLSDFQLGLLGGPTFALFYTFMGLPIARWAERYSRVAIVAICTALWSAMTMLCGVAVNFPMLLAARLGVGVGEAGCVPPSQSVLADYFPADKRAAAISIYLMSIPIGGVVGAAVGGLLGDQLGWRWAFVVLGLPGVIIAILSVLTVKEPPRSGAAEETPKFSAVLKEVAGKASFWHIAVGAGLFNFVAVGNGQYSASFMMRVHSLSLSEVGLITGPIVGGVTAISVYFVGKIINALIEKDRAWLARWPAIGTLLYVPLMISAYLAPTIYIMLPLQVLAVVCGNAYLISLYAMAQGVVAPRMRATATALVMMVISLLGYGLGPPLVGALSDYMQAHAVAFGLSDAAHAKAQGLRFALAIGVLVNLWSALHFFIGSTRLKKDWVG